MIETIPKLNVKVYPVESPETTRFHKRVIDKVKIVATNRTWLLYFVGFLLGRAVILSIVSPFAIAYIATVWAVYRRNSPHAMIAVLLGAFSYNIGQGAFISLTMLVFMFLAGFFKRAKNIQMILPLFVFFSTFTTRLFIYSIASKLTYYEWMLIGVEGILGSVLVLIFMQSIPLLSQKRYKPTLKNEEIVCMIILIASILTGMVGWGVFGASLEVVFSRYFVLVMSFVGGAAIGSTVGVVAGLVLSLANVGNLYQMSLLAFSGLLGGLLKEGKKLGVSAGLLIGTLLVGIYGDASSLPMSITESSIAILLFYVTPTFLFDKISRYIPGTEAYTNEQEQYLQKVRNVTAERVEQFSNVFQALSKSFSTTSQQTTEDHIAKRETDYFLSQITEKTCQKCFMKERCWKKQFDETYSLMEVLKNQLAGGSEPNRQTLREFQNYCVKSRKVLDTMKEEISIFDTNQKLKKQVLESKQLVAEQLQGVSEVMDDFAKEILKEREHHEKQELQIVQGLKQLGIELEKLDIYQLDKGNVDIEMVVSFYSYHGEGQKLIAPFLSDILNELIVVKEENISPFPNGYCYLSFGSAREFVIKTGVANAAKGGGLISGDSYSMIELGEGKYAMAISDGMGNGTRAREESEETLRLLHQILQTGIPEHVAIKSINSILSLRTTDEMFSTLDLSVINLHNAVARFLKIGSTPSFIKRGDAISHVSASNLPIGIIQEFDVDIISKQLKAGDILVMMSDGIFDAPNNVARQEDWFRKKLTMLETDDPQHIADLILEEVIRAQSGEIRDDMTVLVAKVEKNTPKWSAVPIYDQSAQ